MMRHFLMNYASAAVILLAMPSILMAQDTRSQALERSIDYIAEHGVSVVRSSDGGTLVILQTDFDRDVDAELRVILGKDGMFAPEADLGSLQQITGLQVFKAPPSVDVSRFDEVHVWHRETNSVIGVAPLR